MQTNLRERLSRCRSTAKCVSACLRAVHSKKKKKRCTTHLSSWLLLKAPFTCALYSILKQKENVHYDHSSSLDSDAEKSAGVAPRVSAVPGLGQEMALWVQRGARNEGKLQIRIKTQRNPHTHTHASFI